MWKALLFVVCLCVVGSVAQREEKSVLDGYVVGGSTLFITPSDFSLSDPAVVCNTGQTSGCTQSEVSINDSSVIGGQRNILLSADRGDGTLFQTSVVSDSWTSSTPVDSSGFSRMQYDGQDGTADLDISGLQEDLTEDLADAFEIDVETDVTSDITISIYEGGQTCEFGPLTVVGNAGVVQTFEIDYSQFSGNCPLTNVGAIEILVEMFDNVDVIISKFVTTGEVAPTPSPSPSNQPDPSSSNTPSRTPTPGPTSAPSQSNTPSRTPTPQPEECVCNCPTFFCGLVFAVPGDDDDSVDDEWFDDDDDIIYRPVYYDPVDDDFYGINGTDDHDNISFEGGLTRDHNDDDDDNESSSNASTLAGASAALAATAAFLLA